MERIYQGESLNFVFRCRDKHDDPVSMEGYTVSVLLRDGFGKVVYRFSTLDLPGVKRVNVSGNVVLCHLDEEDTSRLYGVYVLEVKVTQGDLVMIEMLKRLKIYGSVIGEEVKL